MATRQLQSFPIPSDFQDLVKCFAREVLRHQPSDIYEFGKVYFESIE